MRIVPHSPTEREIYYAAAYKFHGGDYPRSHSGSRKKPFVTHSSVCVKYRKQTGAAAYRHTPMRIPAADNLHKIISTPADSEQGRVSHNCLKCLGGSYFYLFYCCIHFISSKAYFPYKCFRVKHEQTEVISVIQKRTDCETSHKEDCHLCLL